MGPTPSSKVQDTHTSERMQGCPRPQSSQSRILNLVGEEGCILEDTICSCDGSLEGGRPGWQGLLSCPPFPREIYSVSTSV